jgi:hypothetical protein
MLAGPLEPTNWPYAVAKIAGIETYWPFNRLVAPDARGKGSVRGEYSGKLAEFTYYPGFPFWSRAICPCYG